MTEADELDTIPEEEDEASVSYDIATYPSDFTLWGIYEMWTNNDITIPEFQREFVWTIKQASLLIESFLVGLPVPPVFFYIDDENKNLVIDGQQRILSTAFYFDGFFGVESIQGKKQVFRLKGLDLKSPYYEKQFTELSSSDQRKLKTSVLRAINIRQLAPKDLNTSIYHIFERLNTGGTPLKPQEIRNCVFRGDFIKILRELNKDPNWRMILGQQNFEKHQKDVELVLRMFALSESSKNYEKPMKEFLNKTMKQNQKGDTSRVEKFVKAFPEAARVIVESLGEKPFHVRGPINTSILDSIFCTVMDNLEKSTPNLKNKFDKILKEDIFLNQTTSGTTDTNTVRERFELVKKFLVGE